MQRLEGLWLFFSACFTYKHEKPRSASPMFIRQAGRGKSIFCEVAAFYYMLKYDQRCSILATSLADTAANSEMCCFFLLEVFIIDYYVVRISYTYTKLNSLCFVIFSLVGCMNPKHPAKPGLLLYNRYSFLINLQVMPGCISNSLSPV